VPTQIPISRYSRAYIDYSHEFVGTALARFERSTLPEHNGTRTILLRILKMITPAKCVIPLYDNRVHLPKEGELLHRRVFTKHKFHDQAWGVNIDVPGPRYKCILRGFQLLWDA
jgi:hypothetical protein